MKAERFTSKICRDKELRRLHKEHRRRLRRLAPAVDNSVPPSQYMFHLRRNLKKEQAQYDRADQINKHNIILLQRMAHIMQNGGGEDWHASPYPKFMPRRGTKQNKLQRVQEENMAILGRITSAAPHYPKSKHQREWRKNTKRMRSMQNFPHVRHLEPLQHPEPFRLSVGRDRDEMSEMLQNLMAERQTGPLPSISNRFRVPHPPAGPPRAGRRASRR